MAIPTDSQIIAGLKKQKKSDEYIRTYLKKWHETGERLKRERRAKQ